MLTSWANEILALDGNRIPVPLEELDDDLWRKAFRVTTCSGMPQSEPFPEFCLGDGAAVARASRDERANSPYMTGTVSEKGMWWKGRDELESNACGFPRVHAWWRLFVKPILFRGESDVRLYHLPSPRRAKNHALARSRRLHRGLGAKSSRAPFTRGCTIWSVEFDCAWFMIPHTHKRIFQLEVGSTHAQSCARNIFSTTVMVQYLFILTSPAAPTHALSLTTGA